MALAVNWLHHKTNKFNVMKRIFILFLFFGLFVSVYAQSTRYPEWTTYLQGKMIVDIAESGDYLWLAAGKEVVRFQKSTSESTHYGFDGIELVSEYMINTIDCDKNGLPWVGATFTGTLKMIDDHNWILLPPVSTSQFEAGTSEIIFADDDVVWTASYSVLSRYNGETVDTFRVNGSISSMTIDGRGNIWLGTSKGFVAQYEGLLKFDGLNWTIFNSMPTGFTMPLAFGDLVADDNGRIWMGGSPGLWDPYSRLVSFDGINWEVYEPEPLFESPFFIRDIAIDAAGSKWLATNKGLVRFDGNQWITYDVSNSGLPSNNVYTIYIGAGQTIWLGTNDGLVAFAENITQVNSKSMSSDLEVFPNPASETITIELPSSRPGLSIHIFDVRGSLCKSMVAENAMSRVDISGLADGLYIIKVQSDLNYAAGKFVKQR